MRELSGRILVNGRYRTHRITGVQRYAQEVVRQLGSRAQLVEPAHALEAFSGHLWEQFILPLRIPRERLLWSPANTGPLSVSNQVVTLHDTSVLEHPEWFDRSFSLWYRFLLPQLARRVRTVLTISEFSRARLVAFLSLPEERVVAAPAGVDVNRFFPCDPGAVRARYRLPERYVLFVGSLEPRKNIPALLQAWKHVPRDRDTQLVIAGSTGRVFRQQRLREIPEGVRFLGYVADEELPGLYSGAAAFVIPSLWEGFGLTALEAMACGVPVVASTGGALPEIVADAGLLVDPLCVEALSEALTRVLSDAALRSDLSRRGLARACGFSWERTAEAVWKVLRSA